MLPGQSLNIGAIAEHFKTARQAVSLHVQLLNKCCLIAIKQQVKERHYEARLERLTKVSPWVEASGKT